MSSLASGISNLFSSLFEILGGILNSVFSAVQSVFGLAQDLISSIFDLMSGLVGFVLCNIVIIGVLVAAYVGYSAYRQKNQGGGVTGGVKRS